MLTNTAELRSHLLHLTNAFVVLKTMPLFQGITRELRRIKTRAVHVKRREAVLARLLTLPTPFDPLNMTLDL
jgi:hypothetical protein